MVPYVPYIDNWIQYLILQLYSYHLVIIWIHIRTILFTLILYNFLASMVRYQVILPREILSWYLAFVSFGPRSAHQRLSHIMNFYHAQAFNHDPDYTSLESGVSYQPGCLRCGKVLLILLPAAAAAPLLLRRLLVRNVIALARPVLVSPLKGRFRRAPGQGSLGRDSACGRRGEVQEDKVIQTALQGVVLGPGGVAQRRVAAAAPAVCRAAFPIQLGENAPLRCPGALNNKWNVRYLFPVKKKLLK